MLRTNVVSKRNKVLTAAVSAVSAVALAFGVCMPASAMAEELPSVAAQQELEQVAVEQATYELNATASVVSSAKTAVDWFKSRGSSDAVDAIMNSKYADYTKVGSKTDATDLKNMKASLELMKVFNERYRKGLNLPELKTNDLFMAYAIADANWSDSHIAHAQQFSCGENLAWNWGSDPYKQWYDEEKALYDKGVQDYSQIGHYLNIIDPSYKITGFGINTNGSQYGITYSQTFGSMSASNSETVTDYYNNFMKYYNANVDATTNASVDKNADGSIKLYRLYNPTSMEHLFTADTNERDFLLKQTGNTKFNDENSCWNAPEKSGTPVYRLFNPNSGEHIYTTDLNEIKVLTTQHGWTDEGIKWYSDDAKGVEVYRLFNPAAGIGAHHYTADANELKVLTTERGWKQETTGWYGTK